MPWTKRSRSRGFRAHDRPDFAIEIKPAAKWIEVKDKIEAAFRRNADIDARRINVNTSAGAVTLSGSVSSWAERDEAASATWSAPGVSTVNDDIIGAP